LLAFTRAGVDSQLTPRIFKLFFSDFQLLPQFAVEVRPIQTIREYFQPDKMARAFEIGCIVAKKGAKGPIFEGDMPLAA
jgi:hypothetical protein